MESISRDRPKTQVALELARLGTLSVKALKDYWRSLYETEPPRYISRDLLTRAVSYRLQERAFGSLKPTTLRLLERLGGITQRIIRFTLLRGRPLTVPCWFGSGAESVIASKYSTTASFIRDIAISRCQRSRG
jgi:hypothetical protein